MATKPLCSVPDCDKPASKREWCHKHYRRWLVHGDPLGGGKFRPPAGSALAAIQQAIREAVPDACWKWPLADDGQGYGQLWVGSKHMSAHRVVCIEAHGRPPTPQHEAAHSCGKGHEGCVNPHHLSWKTKKENEHDKIGHGTLPRGEKNPQAKLKQYEVDAIRYCYEFCGISQHALGRCFGVRQTTISKVISEERWGNGT